LLQEERQVREALEVSRQTAELEQQRHAAMSQQAAALSVGANGLDADEGLQQQQQQWRQGGDAMDEDPEPMGHNAAAAGGSRPSFATGISNGRGRGMGRAGRGGRAGRAGRRGAGGYGGNSNGPQWQEVSEGFEGVGESADPLEVPPAAKVRQAQRDLPPESDAAGPSAHRATAEGAQRGPTAAFMAAATAAGARAQQQQPRQQQSCQQQWQPRKAAVSAGSSTTCNIVDDAGSDTDSDSVTGPFAGGW
jgi:hypothetical protein